VQHSGSGGLGARAGSQGREHGSGTTGEALWANWEARASVESQGEKRWGGCLQSV
jgi:hypothetical protein